MKFVRVVLSRFVIPVCACFLAGLSADAGSSPPDVVCQDTTVYLNGIGSAAITPEELDGGSDFPGGFDYFEVSQDMFGCSDVGDVSVTLTGFDSLGQSDFCDATVTVVDDLPPNISVCATNQYASVAPGGSVALPDFTLDVIADDNCEASPVVTQSPVAGTLMNEGTNTVTISVDDNNGNSTDCYADFIVTTAPVVESIDVSLLYKATTNSSYIYYTITFSEYVTNMNANAVIFDRTNFPSYFGSCFGCPPAGSFDQYKNPTNVFHGRISTDPADGFTNATFSIRVSLTNNIMDLDGNLLAASVTSAVVEVAARHYQLWAMDKGLTPGVNFSYSENPDDDTRISGREYVHDGDPLAQFDIIKRKLHIANINGTNYFVMTIASPEHVEYGSYSGGTWLQMDTCEDSLCMAELVWASDDIGNILGGNLGLMEDPSIPTPAGMPALSPGFNYRHFRFSEPVENYPYGFILTETRDDD